MIIFFVLKFLLKLLGESLITGGEDCQKLAEEAFDLLDMDHNGTIERGDIE